MVRGITHSWPAARVVLNLEELVEEEEGAKHGEE